ncbi:MAG: AMP-binding protein [Granulosicoccus sp.]
MNSKQYTTLVDVLQDRGASQHGITIVNGQGEHERIAYGQMLSRAQSRLAQFQSLGLGRGSQLIIQTSDNAAFLEAFWACLLGGITAVPISGGNTHEHKNKFFRIAAKLGTPGVYTDSQTSKRLHDFAQDNGLVNNYAELAQRTIDCTEAAPVGGSANIVAVNEDDVAFIQFSSGSTSAPKGVVLTHKNLLVNTRSIIVGCHMTQSDHLFSWMPLTHDMGLIGFHLTPLVCDVDQALMPTEVFVRRPALWLSEAATLKATMLCSPNFGYQHLLKSFKPEKHETLDLSSVRLVFNGAEPISVDLCQRFMQSLAPFNLASDAMCPVYGLAEASLAVTFPRMDDRFKSITINRGQLGLGQSIRLLESDTATGIDFVSVGKPVQDVSVEIRSETGDTYEEGVTGLICIHGANVTAGYYQEPELNSETITDSGWLNTGDLGFIQDGSLYITGRAKDIIFVNGQNVYPHDLEEILIQRGLVERGKVAIASHREIGRDDELLHVFVLHRGDPEELADMGKAMTKTLSEAAGVSVHALVPVPRIPKTTSGKVQRYLLIQGLGDGDYSTLLQAKSVAVEEQDAPVSEASQSLDDAASLLLAICNKEVEGITVTSDDNLFELGISSLTLASIHAAIEEQWPDQVDITDLFDYPTVSELAQLLDAKASG